MLFPGDAHAPLGVDLNELPGKIPGVMADKTTPHGCQRAAQDFYSQGMAGFLIAADGLRPLLGISPRHLLWYGSGVGEAEVKKPRGAVLEQGLDMVGNGVAPVSPSWVMMLQT